MCRFCSREASYKRREAIFEVFECAECGGEFKQEVAGRYQKLRKAIEQAILKIDVDDPDAASQILQDVIQV